MTGSLIEKNLPAIISPSGKFYGSEQTLFSYLKETRYRYDVYINTNDGKLIEKLTGAGKHHIIPFTNVKRLFFQLFLLLLKGKYNSLYFNEGGYVRYVKVLARLFPKKKFIIHIRLTEDAAKSRIRELPGNIRLISVSKYIQEEVYKNTALDTVILSSPYRGNEDGLPSAPATSGEIKHIAVVGRVTPSKGIKNAIEFLEYVNSHAAPGLVIHFYGDVEKNRPEVQDFLQRCSALTAIQIVFHGYVEDKNKIYKDAEVIIHFNEWEPLGVIFFEALNFGIPFIGFHCGGIGEIADNLGIGDLMINKNEHWPNVMFNILKSIPGNIDRYKNARLIMMEQYSVKNYTLKLEELIVQ